MATSGSTTVSSLLEQYQLEEEDVSKQVTDLHIDKISHSHCKKWKSLPAYLKMERIIASDIDTKPIEEEEKRKNFFFKWQDEKGSKATYKVLIEALLEMKCKEDAESVCKLLIAQAQPISSTIADGNSSSPSRVEVSCSDVSTLDQDVHDDLIFILKRKRDEIMNRYASFVSCLCTSVKATGVSVEDFRTYLLKLPAFTNNQQDKLLSGVKDDMKKACTINEIFDLIGEEYTSFLNYDIFLSILNQYCSGVNNNALNYPEHLKAYIDQHKINEFIRVNPELAKITDTDEKFKFKFDIEETSKVAKVLDLKSKIAAILGITPSALRLFSIKKGCLIVTFLTPAFVADKIFSAGGILATKQIHELRVNSVLWVKCGDYRIKVGLKVKLKHQTTPWSFSYALLPGMKPPSLKGWWYLVTEDEETENIRLHQLVEGQELSSLFDRFKYSKAVVLVNTEDHYELSRCFVSSVQEVSLPLLVVKKADGEKIMKHFEFLTGQGIYACVNQVAEVNTQDTVSARVDEALEVTLPGEGDKVLSSGGIAVAMVPAVGDSLGATKGDGVAEGSLDREEAHNMPTDGQGAAKVPPEGGGLPSSVAKVLQEGGGVAKMPTEGDGVAKVSPEGCGVTKIPTEAGGVAKVPAKRNGVANVPPEGDSVAKVPPEEDSEVNEGDEAKRVSSDEDDEYETPAEEPSDSNEVFSQHRKEDKVHLQETDVDNPQGSDVDPYPQKTDVSVPPQVMARELTNTKTTTQQQSTWKWIKEKFPWTSKQVAEPGTEIKGGLAAEIKEHMFSQDNAPKVMTKSRKEFRHIFRAFFHYYPAKNVNDIMKKLGNQHMVNTYKSDFLFYILLLNILRTMYDDEEVKKITMLFLNDFEYKLSPEDVATTVLCFIGEGDFMIEGGSVFHLLQNACIELSEISHELRSRLYKKPVYNKFLFSRMLWLSIAMKFCEVRGESSIPGIQWKKQIIAHCFSIELTSVTISELNDGLKLGQLLELSTSYAFNYQHLGDLLADFTTMRQFCQLRDCVTIIKEYVTSTGDLMALWSFVRIAYAAFLDMPDKKKLERVSKAGDVKGCLEEGINFVDVLYSKIPHGDVQRDYLDAEFGKWVKLLLKIVDVTGSNPSTYFKLFIDRNDSVLEKYRNVVVDFIVEATVQQFSHLKLPQFLDLFKSFRFWTSGNVQKFLLEYEIPCDINLNDTIWTQFITAVVSRFTSASNHSYLVDFLFVLEKKYEDVGDQTKFIIDLMKLRVENLLSAIRSEELIYRLLWRRGHATAKYKNAGGSVHDIEVRQMFSNRLSNHIRDNSLQCSIIAEMTNVLNSISDYKNGFQLLVLNVLHHDVLPGLRIVDIDAKSILEVSVKILMTSFPQQTTSTKELFCFAILNTCCSKITISADNFHWAQHYAELQLGKVFETYCKWNSLSDEKCIMAAKLHENVHEAYSSSKDILKYFGWIAELQKTLQHWKKMFYEDNVNYGEIICYESTLPTLKDNVYPASLLVNCEIFKETFLHKFEALNILLLQYIPEQPDAQWSSLPALLEKYDVHLPQEARDLISTYVVFPNQESQIPEEKLLSPSLNPGITSKFLPGNEISLKLHKQMTLNKLKRLVKVVNFFQCQLLPDLNMLVFFKLNKSDLFESYLQHYLGKMSNSEQDTTTNAEVHPSGIIAPAFKQDPMQDPQLQNLLSALKSTSKLIHKIKSDTATYSGVTAEDKLMLQKLDIKREFDILSRYLQGSSPSDYSEKLKGVRSMLELFQYTMHVETIQAVCEQFHLEKCTNDCLLKELVSIPGSFANRSNLTPKEAAQKMDRVKEILLLGGNKSPKYLDIFPAIRNSAPFYQFVKQFKGPQGQANFLQQYQLITAQLQHEEYDEQVLNHLRAAFKVISPFMDENKTFSKLIEEVVKLDAVSGQMQLETVNANITLIRLWFSRAEGDTLENVKNELDCIIGTGNYNFNLGEELGSSEGKMFLNYDFHYTSQSATGVESQTDPGKVHRTMNGEQIRDFVRRLGFLDKGEDEDVVQKIRKFLHLSQTISKLFELYLKLRELGHPDYLSRDMVHPIPCSIREEDLESMVQTAQHSVTKWNREVSILQDRFSWLLFLSVPKILQLNKLIQASHDEGKAGKIIHEVSFLMSNQHNEGEKLHAEVLDAIAKTVLQDTALQVMSPMLVAGKFLDLFFKDYTITQRDALNITNYLAQPLYSCSNSRLDFLTLILNIFSGIPEAYQVLHCKANTTEEELTRFLKRVEKHSGHYLMLDINMLPFKLQEVLVQVHFGMQRIKGESECHASQCVPSTIHFVESAPSILREMPWILIKDSTDCCLSPDEAKRMCKQVVNRFSRIEVVYGEAGNGKTYYIKKQLDSCSNHLTISINEAFSPLEAITDLRSLPLYKKNVGLFFNFTLYPPHEMEERDERNHYHEIMEVVSWFFFDLLLLGYVEDPNTGLSFCIPRGLGWSIYAEVPCHRSVEESFKLFFKEVPTLKMLGSLHLIDSKIPYDVDDDVQLVCKYLRAHKLQTINRKHIEGFPPLKFSRDRDIPEKDCHKLLQDCMPKHAASTKITQKLFIRYMKRRCDFLDCLPAFNYNQGSGEYIIRSGKKIRTNTEKLGSTLMETMLSEVSDFCDPRLKENWSLKPHKQLIYDFKDGGASFGLISLHPEKLSKEEKQNFIDIGVVIPSMPEMYTRDLLDSYLSRALNMELENGRLTAIDDSAYVLTLDYAIKMLDIHERFKCGVPVVIEGETGVGKTALVEMLSRLWNHSLLLEWEKEQNRLLDLFKKKLGVTSSITSSNEYQECFQAVAAVSNGELRFDSILLICNYCDTTGKFYSQLNKYVLPMKNNPVVPFLAQKEATPMKPMEILFEEAEQEDTPEATAHLVLAILQTQVEPTFHKINVHAAMTPADVKGQFKVAFNQAKCLQAAYQEKTRRINDDSSIKRTSGLSSPTPFVTVFLDEVNTSSCLGLFKEIIVDRTCGGIPIPDNVFIVAACNPHRSNSLASHKTWIRGTYYVRSLHPTLKLLMWDYSSLDEYQERDYIYAKMVIMNKSISKSENLSLAKYIVESQNKMRDFAYRQLKKQLNAETALTTARSCVSQRDIQRVFTFYQWFIDMFEKCKRYNKETHQLRALLLALGLVYHMRLNFDHRTEYAEYLNSISKKISPSTEISPSEDITFTSALNDELNYYISEIVLPKGIARTLALKENLFATIICTATHTPLIIVGAPGSSKTLSFNQAISNLRGQESKEGVFRTTEIFRSLDPHYYQCSRRTTSEEIETVFSRAINRQRSHTHFKLPIYCVVFMDEAGLPEESHESLKVLHYYLDNAEVSFVAITNHVLDAAKTNRAISLFRPDASKDDLETLAEECLSSDPEYPPRKEDLQTVVKFCTPYLEYMQHPKFSHFFGLRDFIHFVNYLRRKQDKSIPLSLKVVVQAVERNFNGFDVSDHFSKFFEVLEPHQKVDQRHVLEVIQDSLKDHPQDWAENEVRYKLLIDPSEDDSLVRLLFSFDVLKRENTRIFMCSDFPEDGEIQKVNTIAAIRHSAFQGHTVVMSQTDDIHESFYDLFNQRFRRINDPERARYYANIAIGSHSKPCRVDLKFQCVVVIKKSEVITTPAPFLNRFEKYLLSHESLLQSMLQDFPPYMATMIQAAKEKVNSCINSVFKEKSFYGLQPETLDSLILDFLPPLKYKYKKLMKLNMAKSADMEEIPVYLFQELLKALRNNAGFNIPKYPKNELMMDVDHILNLMECVPKFSDLLNKMTHQDAMQAVMEAFNLLHSRITDEDDKKDAVLTPDGCMVVSFLLQVLVRLFVKKLMNLMTTEAVVLYRNKIPSLYLENYLTNQAHFSLKEVITNYHMAHKATICDPCASPNKVLCFTRSSPLIHILPARFPHVAMAEEVNNMDDIILESTMTVANLVFEEADKLMVHKLSSHLSQKSVQELLHSFFSSATAEVCVLLANMQVTTQKMINHIRVMIEEAEPKMPTKSCKVFVLLLHFTPTLFYQHCYPSLFLRGWDHCYLDTVAHSQVKGVVDIQDWFIKSCFPQEPTDNNDTLSQALNHILYQIISALSARVYFGNTEGSPFNSTMNASQRSEALRDLLFEKGVGEILCKKFRAYWKAKVMAEYLEKAATFSQLRESTLNITDSIQAQFKSLFVDFCVYMLTEANKNFNLDNLFAEDPNIHNLFIDIFTCLPVPMLQQLNVLSNDLTSLQPPIYCPRFPFFSYIYELIEKQVDLSEEATNRKTHKEQGELSTVPVEKEKALIKSVMADLLKGDQKVLKLISDAMACHQKIWMCYFNDFIAFKLKLVDSSHTPQADIALQLIHVYFERLHSLELPLRIVHLHCHASIHHVSLAQLVTILRPLSKIEGLQQGVLASSSIPSPTSVTDLLVQTAKQTKSPLGPHSSSFVINTLFNVLTVAGLSDRGIEKLDLWSKSYRDIMSLPFYYSHCVCDDNCVREAMLNVMQATFVTLQSANEDIQLKGHQNFLALYSRFFKGMMQGSRDLLSVLPSECSELKSSDHPDLAEVMHFTIGAVSSSGSMASPHCSSPIWLAREGLMSHYFSPARQKYAPTDVQWFLNFANTPKWCFQRDLEVMPRKLEDDWTGKRKKSTCTLQTKPLLPPGTNLLKFYLGRILGAYDKEHPKAGPLLLYHQHFHTMIGEVLMQSESLGDAGPYVPFYYQETPTNSKQNFTENPRMQQSLCHLYFFTVVDHLWSKKYILSRIVKFATDIQELLKTAKGGKAVVLRVELEAVIQVLIKQLALYFDPTQLQIVDVSYMRKEINNILDNPTDMVRQRGMVLALHFMKQLKGSKKFIHHIDGLKSINCVRSIHQELQSPPTPELKPHLFSFLHDGATGELGTLYKHVVAMIMDIHTEKDKSVQRFLQFCMLKDSPDRRCTIKMVLWLVTYYEFYDKQIASPILCQVFEGHEMSGYMNDRGCIWLIQCFLDPSHRLCRRNSFSHLDQQTSLEPGQDIEKNSGDSLYRLFVPDTTEEPDNDLCHSLANLVAVILGRPQHSNHLWYHLFAPQKLENSYITGFMYDSTVHRDGLMYDCGVELTADGEFDRLDYRKHACRGTYTLHSLHLLLWANFGSFCMGLLTQPHSYQQMHGHIFSEELSLRDFCVDHLKSLWKHLSNNLNLLEEQRSFFVMSALTKFHHLSWTPSSDTNVVPSSRGIFQKRKELDCYERMWHTEVFMPALDELTSKFPNQHWNETLRQLYIHFPHFPMVQDLTRSIWSSSDLDEHSEGGRLWLLLKFVKEWECLQVGGALLPHLVELYQWIHTYLSYLLTREQASHFTIGLLITGLDRDLRQHIRDMYDKVQQEYNKYEKLTAGATTATISDDAISDDTLLVDFLTEDESGKDMLYVVIDRIIETHNDMIKSFYSVHVKRLHCILPEKPAEISPREVKLDDAIPGCMLTELHNVSSFLQLVKSRYEPSAPASHSQLPFQLDRLEKDIASNFIVGKPLIEAASTLRKVFKFNVVQDLAERLPEAFKVTLHETLLKKFEYEFHSADYHLMDEVVTALRTILGHLVKALDEGRKDFEELALIFILKLHGHLKSEDQALQEIGVQTKSKPYLDCLTSLPLTATYSCFRLFSRWVNEGFYDFNTLPFNLKVHMRDQDRQSLEEIRSKWTGPVLELVKELQHLIDLLKLSEKEIISQVDSTAEKSISDYLTEKKFQRDVMDYIPRTIMLRHYVEFRLVLRRLQEELKKHHKSEEIVDIWSEFAKDLWEKHYPNFSVEQFEAGPLTYYPETGHYGFWESENDDEIDNFATAVLKEAADSIQKGFTVPQQLDAHAHLSLKARHIDPDGVTHFLSNIGLPQYADEFKDNDIDGKLLLEADSEVLLELGVQSPLHQMKIMQLFPRELLGTKAKYSNDHLSQFLQQQEKLIKYIPVLKKHGIDGDMVLHVEENLMKGVLKEIGIGPVASLKICVNYKTSLDM